MDGEFVVFLDSFAVEFSHIDDKVYFSEFDLVADGDFVNRFDDIALDLSESLDFQMLSFTTFFFSTKF